MKILCFILSTMIFQEFGASSNLRANDQDDLNNMICGPRCICFVAAQFGIELEVAEVVRSIQWPKVEEGVSMATLESYIQEIGLCAREINLHNNEIPNFRGLAIVAEERSGSSLFHFVVISSDSEQRYIRHDSNGVSGAIEPTYWRKCAAKILLVSKLQPVELGSGNHSGIPKIGAIVGLILGLIVAQQQRGRK